MRALMRRMYFALRALPCRCRLTGGTKWHCMAQPVVTQQCSRCATIEEYERNFPEDIQVIVPMEHV